MTHPYIMRLKLISHTYIMKYNLMYKYLGNNNLNHKQNSVKFIKLLNDEIFEILEKINYSYNI